MEIKTIKFGGPGKAKNENIEIKTMALRDNALKKTVLKGRIEGRQARGWQ